MSSDVRARWAELCADFEAGDEPDPIPHGTPSGYTWHKCRCSECRAWSAAYRREYRRRQKARQ